MGAINHKQKPNIQNFYVTFTFVIFNLAVIFIFFYVWCGGGGGMREGNLKKKGSYSFLSYSRGSV